MGKNRSIPLLIAAGFVAFGAFIVFGQRAGDGGDDDSDFAAVTEARSPRGGAGNEDALQGGNKGAGANARKALKKKRPSGNKVDPKLAGKLKVPEKILVATGPPESPKLGIVRQTFTGVRGGAGGLVGSQGGGTDEGENPPDATEDAATCPNCGAPTVRSMVTDIQVQPLLAAAFDATCSSIFIDRGFGERFDIGDDPACIIYIPSTCRGSGAALFEGRFFLSLQGECIPNRKFLIDVLSR